VKYWGGELQLAKTESAFSRLLKSLTIVEPPRINIARIDEPEHQLKLVA
jgi:hypothetical protein